MNTMTQAAQDVLAERARQVNAEGWTPQHDDQHDDGSLALAAACYAAPMAKKGKTDDVDVSGGRGECPVWRQRRFVVPFLWPDSWHGAWWKPGREADLSTDGLGPVSRVPDRRRDLVRAAALLLAEIERLDRAAGLPADAPAEQWPRDLSEAEMDELATALNEHDAGSIGFHGLVDRVLAVVRRTAGVEGKTK